MPAHTYRCPLRWSDMDAFGHVNNTRYLTYLEEARVDMFVGIPESERVFTLDGDVVIVRHEIDYHRPLVHRTEPVRILLWVERIGGASFTLAYEIADEQAVYATATSVLASYDAVALRSRRLTPAQRTWLESFQRDVDGATGA